MQRLAKIALGGLEILAVGVYCNRCLACSNDGSLRKLEKDMKDANGKMIAVGSMLYRFPSGTDAASIGNRALEAADAAIEVKAICDSINAACVDVVKHRVRGREDDVMYSQEKIKADGFCVA
jgi:hypothetical protein